MIVCKMNKSKQGYEVGEAHIIVQGHCLNAGTIASRILPYSLTCTHTNTKDNYCMHVHAVDFHHLLELTCNKDSPHSQSVCVPQLIVLVHAGGQIRI